MATTRERRCPRNAGARRQAFDRETLRVGRGPVRVALLRALLQLGYRRIRWRPGSGGVFTAVDEQDIRTVIVVDVSPVRDGFPEPLVTPARAACMEAMCLACLQDDLRVHRVRADYIALPEGYVPCEVLALTQRRGVAWAFDSAVAGTGDAQAAACRQARRGTPEGGVRR